MKTAIKESVYYCPQTDSIQTLLFSPSAGHDGFEVEDHSQGKVVIYSLIYLGEL